MIKIQLRFTGPQSTWFKWVTFPMKGFEPVTTVQEVLMLPLCYAAPYNFYTGNTDWFNFIATFDKSLLWNLENGLEQNLSFWKNNRRRIFWPLKQQNSDACLFFWQSVGKSFQTKHPEIFSNWVNLGKKTSARSNPGTSSYCPTCVQLKV